MTTNGVLEAQDVPRPLTKDMAKEPEGIITEKTRVPIGLAISAIVTIVAGGLWLNSHLMAIQRNQWEIENRLGTIETRLLDRWTASDMRVWTLKLRMENPAIKIPEPDTNR